MAAATLTRALPAPVDGVSVFQGDALQIATRTGDGRVGRAGSADQQGFVFQEHGGTATTFHYQSGETGVTPNSPSWDIPDGVVARREWPRVIAECVEAAKNGDRDADVLRRYPDLSDAVATLAEIIERDGDSVWRWYIVNALGPRSLSKRRVSHIVSNPPWLRYSDIQTEPRKSAVNAIADEHALGGKGQNRTGLDLCAVMIAETRKLYLPEGAGTAVYVAPRGALDSGNWEGFRRRNAETAPGTVMLDLAEKGIDGRGIRPGPFKGHSEACVAGWPASGGKTLRLRFRPEAPRDRVKPDEKWDTLAAIVEIDKRPAKLAATASSYAEHPRQGATIVPAALVRIDPARPDRTLVPTRAKEPWASLGPQAIEDIPTGGVSGTPKART